MLRWGENKMTTLIWAFKLWYYVLLNVWACPCYGKYHEGIMIARTINNPWACSVDTTHMLNDLLPGKPEDKRRFYIHVRGVGFARLTILKGTCMWRVHTSSRQCMMPRGWLGNPCALHSCPCVPPSHDADDASKIKHTASSKKLARDRVLIIAPFSWQVLL